MADFVDFNKKEDEEEQQKQAGTPVNLSTSQSATIGEGGGVQPVSPTGGTSSGRYTNIGNYLRANQGFNQAGGGLAGKVVGNIQQAQSGVQQQVQGAQNQFNQQSLQNRRQLDQGLLTGALNDPSKVAADQNQFNQFEQMRDAEYKGPRQLNDYEKLQANAQNVKSLADQTGSESGRFNLLREMFNKPTYSSGQQKLDNLFLQGNKDQSKQLVSSRPIATRTIQGLQKSQESAQNQANLFNKEALDTRGATRNALQSNVLDSNKAIENAAIKAQQDREAYIKAAQEGLAQGFAPKDIIERLGLQSGQTFYDIDPTQYMSANQLKATKQNTASQQDYARMQALAKLSGNVLNPEASRVFQEFYDPSQAGKFQNSQAFDQINKDLFLQDVRNREQQFNTQAADPNQRIAQANNMLYSDWFKTPNYQTDAEGNQYNAGDILGMENALKHFASQIRNTDFSYNDGETHVPVANPYQNISDYDAYRAYEVEQLRNQGYDQSLINEALNNAADPGALFTTKLKYERDKLANAQSQFDQIKNLFKANRTIQEREIQPSTRIDETAIAPKQPVNG